MPYLIDGHNLISHLDDIDLADPHDEAKLVLKLRGFCARTRKKVTVIFDEGLPGGTSGLTTHSVHVVFASSKRTNADTLIRQRIQKTPDAKNWTLVSSDNEILDSARDAGMRGMKSVEFASLLQRKDEPKPHRGINPHVYVPTAEIAEWLEIFGEDAPTELQATDPAPRIQPHYGDVSPRPSTKAEPEATPPQRHKKQTPALPDVAASNATAHEVDVSQAQVEEWLEIFGEDATSTSNTTTSSPPARPPSSRRRLKQRDMGTTPKVRGPDATKPAPTPKRTEKPTPEEAPLHDVEAWLEIFGSADDIEPTDWRPQRSDPSKQGRFGKNKGEPVVHKNMATSDEIYLSDGEVEKWMDFFGAEDEDD